MREQSLKYTFDAAGRNVTTSSVVLNQYIGGSVTQSRDGDGLELKRAETRQLVTTFGYRVRSTVLGGRVVTELDANGQKQKSYVYLHGERLAEQEGGYVTWAHTNPLTGSEGSSYAGGMYGGKKEADPMLVDVGFDDPYLNFEEPRPDSLQLLGGNSNGQCTVEGMTWDCMSANRLREMGAAEEMVPITVFAIQNNGKTRAIWSGLVSTDPLSKTESSSPVGQVGGTGSTGNAADSGSVVLAGTSDSSVTIVAGASYVYTGPQKQVPEIPLNHVQLRADLEKVLKGRKDCGEFIRGLLFTVAQYTQLPLYSQDFLDEPLNILDAVASQEGYFLAKGQGASGYAYGALRFGTAKVTLDISMGNDVGASIARGLLLLHENAHEAGTAGYLDRELAIAAYQTAWAQGYQNIPTPPTTSDDGANSQYFSGLIFQACHPRQGKRFPK